jgi:hypothetical protein
MPQNQKKLSRGIAITANLRRITEAGGNPPILIRKERWPAKARRSLFLPQNSRIETHKNLDCNEDFVYLVRIIPQISDTISTYSGNF